MKARTLSQDISGRGFLFFLLLLFYLPFLVAPFSRVGHNEDRDGAIRSTNSTGSATSQQTWSLAGTGMLPAKHQTRAYVRVRGYGVGCHKR